MSGLDTADLCIDRVLMPETPMPDKKARRRPISPIQFTILLYGSLLAILLLAYYPYDSDKQTVKARVDRPATGFYQNVYAQTVGFKQDRSALSTFDEVMIQQDGTPASTTNGAQLGQLGLGSVAEEPMIDFTQGALEETAPRFVKETEGLMASALVAAQ